MLEIVAVIAVCVAILWALEQYCLPGTPRAPLTRDVTAELPYSRAAVWHAIFAHTRFLGPIGHIDQARAGDLIAFETIAGVGRWAEITRMRALVHACTPGRHVRLELVEQDGQPFVGGSGNWNSYTLDETATGTRLTISLHVTPRSMLEQFLIGKALEIDMRKIKARIEEPEPDGAVSFST